MPDVVLIRPGCTDFDEQNRIQGSLDLPLSQRGQEQVISLVEELRALPLEIVYSAPCEPARSTAVAICEACGAAYKELDDFQNLNHGLWQGLQVDDVRRKFPKVFKQWQESPETVCLPEGETVSEAIERIQRALRKCLKRKRTFGIVASEPLATLIGCVLRGLRPELPDSAMSGPPSSRFEVLHLSEDASHHPACVSSTSNGADHDANNCESKLSQQDGSNGTVNPHRSARKNGAQNQSGTDTHNGAGKNNGHGQPASHEKVTSASSSQIPPQGGVK